MTAATVEPPAIGRGLAAGPADSVVGVMQEVVKLGFLTAANMLVSQVDSVQR